MEIDDFIVLEAKKKILYVCRSVCWFACLSVETVSFKKVDGLKSNLVGVFNVHSIALISNFKMIFLSIRQYTFKTYFKNLEKNGNSLVGAI